MRFLLVLVLAACYVEPPATPPARRPLVTDNLPYLVERAKVRAWHDHNDWCLRRQWPSSDEFVICNSHPYLNRTTPAMYALVKYDAQQRAIAYAVFTPVPCRMYGRCDEIYARTALADERDFVDHFSGLLDNLAQRGRSVERQSVELPEMQHLMFEALKPEMMKRFGAPTWQDPLRYGATWATRTSTIGLFVAGKGYWVVETHELRPPGMVTAAL
jgi:hypothetical protein